MSMDTHAVCFSKQMTREVRRGARRPEVVPACLRCESAIPLELHPPLRVSAARKFHHFLAAPFPALERRLSGVRGRLARVAAHPRGALPQRTGAARASASWARPSCASSTGRTCHAIAWIGRGCRPKRTAFCAPPIWPAPPSASSCPPRSTSNACLTATEARAIDSAIDQYDQAIADVVKAAPSDGLDWYLLDLAALLDRLAHRRYLEDAAARPPMVGAIFPARGPGAARPATRFAVFPLGPERSHCGRAVLARRRSPDDNCRRERGPISNDTA